MKDFNDYQLVKALRLLPFLLIFLTISLYGNAQEVFHYPAFLSEHVNSDDQAMKAMGQHLQSLVSDNLPRESLKWGQQKKFGEGTPMVVQFDANSAGRLYANNPAYSGVELLLINITSSEELKSPVDLEKLKGFESLKYLLIRYTYDVCGNGSADCLPSQVAKNVTGDASPVIVLYELSIAQ